MTTKEYNELFSVPMKKEITLTFDNGLTTRQRAMPFVGVARGVVRRMVRFTSV